LIFIDVQRGKRYAQRGTRVREEQKDEYIIIDISSMIDFL